MFPPLVTKIGNFDRSQRPRAAVDDNPGSRICRRSSKLPIFVTSGGNIGLGQRFNRFDVRSRATPSARLISNRSLTETHHRQQ